MPWTFCRVLYLNPAYHLKKRRQLVGRDTFLLYQITDKPLFYLGKQSHCFNVCGMRTVKTSLYFIVLYSTLLILEML